MFKGHHQYGDWLGIDAPEGSYKGSSREELIAQGYYAYSTSLVVKAGKILGKDVSAYEKLYKNIVKKFREVWNDEYKTQTEHAIALYFKLAKDMMNKFDELNWIVRDVVKNS
jgi:alpha-L-rhamnosidase